MNVTSTASWRRSRRSPHCDNRNPRTTAARKSENPRTEKPLAGEWWRPLSAQFRATSPAQPEPLQYLVHPPGHFERTAPIHAISQFIELTLMLPPLAAAALLHRAIA